MNYASYERSADRMKPTVIDSFSLATCSSLVKSSYYQWMRRLTLFFSSTCDTLASGGIVLGFMGYLSLLYSIYRQDRNYLLRYVVPSLLAVVSQSGVASAARLFACLGVYAIHQEYYKKMLEAARQTMMTFGESILEIDDDEGDDGGDGDEQNITDAGEGHDGSSTSGCDPDGEKSPIRHRKGPLRVLAYIVKRWLMNTNPRSESDKNK